MKANNMSESAANGGVFNWEGFNEEQYMGLLEEYKERENDEEHFDSVVQCEYEGDVRIGNLCFDISTRRDRNGYELLSFDLFVGGVDTGYGYVELGGGNSESYPYDQVGIGYFMTDWMNLTYEEFIKSTEELFDKCIDYYNGDYKEADLREKANEPLHIW